MSKENWEYKRVFKPSVCSQAPWANLIAPNKRLEVLRLIRNETQDILGINLDECPKRFSCFKTTCLGRPLPYASETALPYLEQLELTHNVKINPESGQKELFIETSCNTCPMKIAKTCSSLCNQMIDFSERDKIPEPQLEYLDDMSNVGIDLESIAPSNYTKTFDEIPFDAISSKKREIIESYILEERDFRSIGDNLLNKPNYQGYVKLQTYSGLEKLSKVAAIREFLKLNGESLSDRQFLIFKLVFIENYTMVAVAKELQVSKQNIQQIISKVLKKNNVTWKPYLKTHNNKPKYSNTGRFK